MTTRAALSIKGVTKSFGATRAVDDVSLAVQPGEFITLLGPSGCGKTSLLNLIAGFLEPDAGEISIAGTAVTRLAASERNIGMVFQNYALFPHMTVAQNVGFGLTMRNVPPGEIKSRVAAALDMVRLPDMGDRKPRQLSGGQQQRIALARALVIRPQLILLDEPFSAIDKNLRAEMQVELKRIQRQVGITTLFVTHDQSEALSLSDRIAVMAKGAVQQLATPTELYRKPANQFVAAFIGEVNRLPCTRRDIGTQAILEAEGVRLELPRERAGGGAGPTHLYLRPDAIDACDPTDQRANLGVATVETHVYQGTHTDMLVRCENGWALRLRHLGHEALERWPRGARIGVAANLGEACVFTE